MEVVLIVLTLVLLFSLPLAIKIVPQSKNYVVERFGRLRTVLGPGIGFIVPYIDVVRHKVDILERQLQQINHDAITRDNVTLSVTVSVFYRVVAPERTVYRIRDIDQAIITTVTGIVRSEIGQTDLDGVQSNRAALTKQVRDQLSSGTDEWGIVVTRAEVIDISLDEDTRTAMLQQLNAERARRAAVTEAEGKKRSIELEADAQLYAAQKQAEARRVQADAEAYATEAIAKAIHKNGFEAVRYDIAKRQVDTMEALANGSGNRTIILPADMIDSFKNAFDMFTAAKK